MKNNNTISKQSITGIIKHTHTHTNTHAHGIINERKKILFFFCYLKANYGIPGILS